MKRRKAKRARLARRKPATRFRTIQQFRKAPEAERERWTLAVNALAKMRAERLTLPQAARAMGVPSRVMIPLVRPALRKQKNGRWKATKRDRFWRVLNVPGPRGPREVAVRDSRTASQIASYSDAIRKYIRTGDASLLKPFRKLKVFDANGRRISLLTNVRALDQLGHAGLLSFESLYARTAK